MTFTVLSHENILCAIPSLQQNSWSKICVMHVAVSMVRWLCDTLVGCARWCDSQIMLYFILFVEIFFDKEQLLITYHSKKTAYKISKATACKNDILFLILKKSIEKSLLDELWFRIFGLYFNISFYICGLMV